VETLKNLVTNISTTGKTDPAASEQPPTALNYFPGAGDPHCPRCRGIGYLSSDAPLGDPQFGKLYPCPCRLQEIAATSNTRRIEISNLGALREKTFQNFFPYGHATHKHQRESLQRAFDTALTFARKPHHWLLLLGGYGCGKTHLAAAIANEVLERGAEVVFTTVPDLLDHLRTTYSPTAEVRYDELFERVRNVGVLILDDLGAESPTPWAQEKLYQLLNHRYNNQLPTVITTNLALERFEPRIRSRIVDTDLVRKVLIDAPDFRKAESDQLELSSLSLHALQTFDCFDLRKAELPSEHVKTLQFALSAAQEFASAPEGWLYLAGGPGCGKTHLAAAIANARVNAGFPALFVTAVDLLDYLRDAFNPTSATTKTYRDRFNEVRETPLLVLDDFAIESATPWAKEKLMQLIDYRILAKLPTVLTTSVSRDQLGDRLESRLLNPSYCVVCAMTAPMYRGSAGNKPKRKLKN
jgi:DNA replication protein DnaC